MENATKALLIAAAVLIVIILIALGVSLLNSAGDTTEQAGQVGEMLGDKTGSASGSAIGAIAGLQGGSNKSFYMILGANLIGLDKEDFCITNLPSTIKFWNDIIEYSNNNKITVYGFPVKFHKKANGYVYIEVNGGSVNRYVYLMDENGEHNKESYIESGSEIINGATYVMDVNVVQ